MTTTTASPYRIYEGEEYLETLQAAAYVRPEKPVSYSWISDRVRDGRLQKHTFESQKPYYKRADLDALLHPHIHTIHSRERAFSEADYLTFAEVARHLSVSIGWVRRRVHAGDLAAVNISGKAGRGAMLRVHVDELARFEKTFQTVKEHTEAAR